MGRKLLKDCSSQQKRSDKMRNKTLLSAVIVCICVVLAFGIWALRKASRPIDDDNGNGLQKSDASTVSDGDVRWDRPPLICVNNMLFKREKFVTSDGLDESYRYLGMIESYVAGLESPSENFQANGPIVGAEIYQSDDHIIIVYNGRYELYYPLD